MKKSEIISPGHLLSYYQEKSKEANDIVNNYEDVYKLIIQYPQYQDERRYITKEKKLLDQGYEDISEDVKNKADKIPNKLVKSEIKYIDARMSKIRKYYKEIRDYYIDNAEYCKNKIQEKFLGVNNLYDEFNKKYKRSIEVAIKNKEWQKGLRLLNELEENPHLEIYVTINGRSFYESDKLSNKTQEIIYWKREIIEKIPQKEYLKLNIVLKKEKMAKLDEKLITLHNESIANFKKINSNYDDKFFTNPHWNQQDENLINEIKELHRDRGYLGNSIISDSKEIAQLEAKVISKNR